VLVPEGRRWALIILVFAVWIAYRVFRILQARRQAAEVMRSLAAETPRPEQRGHRRRTQHPAPAHGRSPGAAEKAKLGGDERRNLYELPWYVIIGPPGSGKTTALVNSGLHFPLAAQLGAGAVRGVGGTRNCDWWFTDQAVLLDTAGRYTTQDSHATVDKAAWLGFLDLLKTSARAGQSTVPSSPSACPTCCSAATPSAPPMPPRSACGSRSCTPSWACAFRST
jgi:type VI secretion system protein ImpL